jgi:hypothetical protein
MAKIVIPQFDPLKIYLNAEGFRFADTCLRRAGSDPNVMNVIGTAQMVLAAFTLELYFKCLLCLETGKVPQTHNLKALFLGLTHSTRQRIDALWNPKAIELDYLFNTMERVTGTLVPRDLAAALDISANAFVRIRYAHEDDKSAFIVGDLPSIVRRVILEKMPDWASVGRAPPARVD